jgi:hypothetical protein
MILFLLDERHHWMELIYVNLSISFDEIGLGVVQPRICGGAVTTNCRLAKLSPPDFGSDSP